MPFFLCLFLYTVVSLFLSLPLCTTYAPSLFLYLLLDWTLLYLPFFDPLAHSFAIASTLLNPSLNHFVFCNSAVLRRPTSILHLFSYFLPVSLHLCWYQECTKRRMVSGTCPSLPYVCHYDTMEDILQRCTRMQRQAKGDKTRYSMYRIIVNVMM